MMNPESYNQYILVRHHQSALLAEAQQNALARQARPERGNGIASLLKLYRRARQPRPTLNTKRA